MANITFKIFFFNLYISFYIEVILDFHEKFSKKKSGLSSPLMLTFSTIDNISLLPQDTFIIQLNINKKEPVNIWDVNFFLYLAKQPTIPYVCYILQIENVWFLL